VRSRDETPAEGVALALPKRVESDPRAQALKRLLETHSAFPRSPRLDAELRSARSRGQLVRGLEAIATRLDGEAHGLALADAKSGTARGGRVSRLVVVAGDGSARFYRQVDSLVLRNRPRVLAIRIEDDGAALGELLFGTGKFARAVLVEHKDAVASVLLALLPDSSPGKSNRAPSGEPS